MAFGAVSTLFFPVAANAGSSLWGTDVRKFITPADAGNDASTKFAMGTNTSAHTVTADPYTSQGSDLTEANYGWAIDPSDMNSVSGAQRILVAGNHVALLRLQSTTNTNPNGTLTMFAYRVGNAAGGRVRTLLGSATLSGITTFDTTIRSFTITLALSEIVFGVDETIQYSFELNGQGVAVTGKNNSFYTGTITGTASKIDLPGPLGYLIEPSGIASTSAVGTPTVVPQSAIVAPSGIGSTSAVGEPTLAPGAVTVAPSGIGSTSGVGTPTLVPGQVVVEPSGIGSTAAVGEPTLVPGVVTIGPDGIGPGPAVGEPTIIAAEFIYPEGIAPTSAVGTPTLLTQPVVTGTVFNHETGDPVGAGVVVKLFDDNDLLIDSTTTDGSSSFTFYRPFGDSDTYWTLAEYELLGVQYHGVSDRGCPAV